MIRNRAVVVLGAGVGQDIQMPLGSQLARNIRKKVRYELIDGEAYSGGDRVLKQAFELGAKRRRLRKVTFKDACYVLERGLAHANSIDDFLFAHAHNEELQLIGKLAIARCIVEAERASDLNMLQPRVRDRITSSEVEKSWLMQLFGLLRGRIRRGEESRLFEGMSIITFNYDRCIEHFLYHALQEYFGIDPLDAKRAMHHLEIIHPYGVVGHLPWQIKKDATPFGAEISHLQSLMLAEQLKTYNEENRDLQTLERLRSVISSAETLILLGFHFHKQNLELLDSKKTGSVNRIYSTVLGRSDNDLDVIRKNLVPFLRPDSGDTNLKIILANCTCSDAFRQYGLEWAG